MMVLHFFCAASAYCESGIPLLKDGQSKYKIVISESSTKIEKRAAEVFQTYFEEISNVNLPIISDEKRLGKTEIILGYNKHLDELKADIPDVDLKADGFLIKTINNNLVIIGGSENGLLHGVFNFLEHFLDCRMYTSSVIIVPRKLNIYLPEIHDYQIPAFKFRDVHYKDAYVSEYAEWHGIGKIHEHMGTGFHSFDHLAHPDKYFESHPEFYSLIDGNRVNKSQFCLTNEDLVDVVEANLRGLMKESPEKEYWGVGQNDNDRYCQCDECRAINEREGSQSGTVIYFVNQIAERFPEKTFVTLAYHYSRHIPKHLKPADNVNIYLCSIECNRSKPIGDDPQSSDFLEDLQNWGRIANKIWIWDYVVHFHGYVSPYPNLHVLQPNIQLFAENNAGAMFQQGDLYGGGEFSELKAYLISKLLWDPYVDIDSVKNDFLTGYYGNASIYIEQYIDVLHDASEIYGKNIHHKINPLTHTEDYLSPTMMGIYHRIFDRAEKVVEDDSVYLKRVKIARLPLEYIDLEITKRKGKEEGGFFEKGEDGCSKPNPEMIEKLKSFAEICKESGVDFLKEGHVSPDEYLESNMRSVNLSSLDHLAIGCTVQSESKANLKFDVTDFSTLTDGFRGSTDWSYAWLGFGDDLELIIDLGELKEISKVQPEFIFDQKRWTFLPDYVICSISEDGERFTEIGKLTHDVPLKRTEALIKTFDFQFQKSKVRYIKIYAKNIGVNPRWHRFSGGNASIYIDEIMVN